MELDERKQTILSAVVENYVATGETTSSKALQSESNINVSTATIRNELNYLDESGYLHQRHTSGGRIPTQKGYRYYVDNLMIKREVTQREKEYIDRMMNRDKTSPESILRSAANVLTELTGLSSVVTTPPSDNSRVYKVKFVATSRYTAMAVLITSNGAVKSRIFRCDFVITPELLAMFDKMINKHLSGTKLIEIDKVFLQSVASKMGEITLYMPQVLIAVYEAVKLAMKAEAVVSGQTNLLFLDGYDILSARDVLRFLYDTNEVSHYLNQINGTKVFIGTESGREELRDSSLITTRYEINSERAGSIALVGPTRTDYKRLLPLIEYVSKCISELISELLDIQRR